MKKKKKKKNDFGRDDLVRDGFGANSPVTSSAMSGSPFVPFVLQEVDVLPNVIGNK